MGYWGFGVLWFFGVFLKTLQLKDVEFLKIVQFGFDITFGKLKFVKEPDEEEKEDMQARFLEDMKNAGTLEFVGRSNQAITTRNINCCQHFEHTRE